MKDRIKQYIEYKGISAGELALKLDVQRSNISHILNGRNKPGAAFIEKLLLVFTDLNARWLLTGKGNMVEGEKGADTPAAETLFTPPKKEKQAVVHKEETPAKKEEPAKEVSKSKEEVSKMILLYDDGTFETFQSRNRK